MNLTEICIQIVRPTKEQRFQRLMQAHHYLGALPKISVTFRYVAILGGQWIALLNFYAPAFKKHVEYQGRQDSGQPQLKL